MYSDGLLKLPIFTIQKNFKILLTVYSLSPLIYGFIQLMPDLKVFLNGCSVLFVPAIPKTFIICPFFYE